MSHAFWTLDRVAAALGGGPRGSLALHGVSTDTRAIAPGTLFVALAGDRFDAHDFLSDAVARGAAAIVVSHPDRCAGLGVPVYAVRDTLVALGHLARYWRRAWARTVVGVAGSNGKTTTKDLTRAALGSTLATHATSGNLNNLVGVPLTLLAMPGTAEVAVVEMGINVPGEMARLRSIAEPDIVVMTSIAEEHLEGLGNLRGVMDEEFAVFHGASVAITPAAQPEIGAAARAAGCTVIAAGLDDGDLRPTRWGLEPDGHGWLELGDVVVRPAARGRHNLQNTMLALAAARALGVDASVAAKGISAMAEPEMRGVWRTVGRATVIDDAYNASPASVRAAIELLAGLDGSRQRVAVLGPMRELGVHSERLHAGAAAQALAAPIDVISGIGEMGTALASAGGTDARVLTAADIDALWPMLAPRLARDGIILLKASRAVKLERLLPLLTAWAAD